MSAETQVCTTIPSIYKRQKSPLSTVSVKPWKSLKGTDLKASLLFLESEVSQEPEHNGCLLGFQECRRSKSPGITTAKPVISVVNKMVSIKILDDKTPFS